VFTPNKKKLIKHKPWIKIHEKNCQKLTEEIGNLRYDTISEFLELLSRIIEKGELKALQQHGGSVNPICFQGILPKNKKRGPEK